MLSGFFGGRKEKPLATVMVVGDDGATLTFVATILESDGYTVISVTNVSEALTLLTGAEMPDIFIGDFRDPQTDATELIRSLKLRYGRTSLSPIVLLLDSVEDEQVAHEMEVHDVIAKPFEADALLRCLKSIATRTD